MRRRVRKMPLRFVPRKSRSALKMWRNGARSVSLNSGLSSRKKQHARRGMKKKHAAKKKRSVLAKKSESRNTKRIWSAT